MTIEKARDRLFLGAFCVIGAALMFSLAGVSIKMAAGSLSNDAIARQDVRGIVSFLDDEFQITVSNGSFLSGVEEMAAAFAQQFKQFEDATYVRTTESVEIGSSAPLAYESGTWVGTWTATRGPLRTGGRYSAYWRRVDGSWKIHSELFVTLFCEGSGCP